MNEELVEEGRVLSSGNGFVEIQLVENESCEECSAKLFCTSGRESSKVLKIKENKIFSAGEKVIVSIPGKNLLSASLNLYFYPLLILVLSIFIGSRIYSDYGMTELYSLLTGIVAVSIYYLIFFKITKNMHFVQPKIKSMKSE